MILQGRKTSLSAAGHDLRASGEGVNTEQVKTAVPSNTDTSLWKSIPWDTCSYTCQLSHRALTAAPTVTTDDKNQPVRPSTQQGPAANVEKVRGAPYKTLLQLFTGKAGCGHAQLSRHRGLGGAVTWRERGLHTGHLLKV